MGNWTKGLVRVVSSETVAVRDENDAHICSFGWLTGLHGRRSSAEVHANADLVAEAFNVAHETGLTPRQLAEQRAELLRQLAEQRAELLVTLKQTARVLADWHKTDFNEIVADGGVTASDVIRQECGWHSARILKAIANAERKP